MDEPVIDERVLRHDLDNLAGVNRYLGGARAARMSIADLIGPGERVDILDVACGGGDVARSLHAYATTRGATATVTGVDRHAQTIRVARERTRHGAIRFVRAEGAALPFADDAFDVAIISLALHHFEGDERAAALREMARVARRRVVVSDLERNWPNYWGARLLAATVWRHDPLARHDGPVSVLRSFSPAELEAVVRGAGLRDVRIQRRFFYRLVASASPVTAAGAHTL